MRLSDLLLEKLNSEVVLSKRIQLAKNVFISRDLRIAYKEEYILTWFLKIIQETDDEEEKKKLIEGFCFCVKSEIMTLLPASGIRVNVKSNISKVITKILKKIDIGDNEFADSVFIILKKFCLHYKSHSKQYVKIMYALFNLNLTHAQISDILYLSSDIFKSGILHEKFVMHLLQKDFHLLLKNDSVTDPKNNFLIQFIQKMFFKKELFNQLQIVLHSICSGHETYTNNGIISAVFSALHNTYTSDVDVNIKVQAFCKVFEAFARLSDNVESLGTVHFFIVLCHLTGLEQAVLLKQTSGEPANSLINESHFQILTNIPPIKANLTSYIIVKHLMEILSSHSPNLNASLRDSTCLQWFQSLALVAINHEQLSYAHLDFFCACADLNNSIIEKNFTKIFSHVLRQTPTTFEDDDFNCSFSQFMQSMLKIYSKLQRIQKFILKLLMSVKCTRSNLRLKNVFPNNFIREFSNLITLMPSTQSLSFMDDLIKTLNDHCVKILEENNGESVNVLLIQSTCALLAAFLCGVRVLSHITPQGIVKSFIEKNREIKEILGRFGEALLIRIHDRDIVQPFLNLSFYWGEFELLILCYVEEHGVQLTNKDISPADLSTLHSYLSGEEWNVLAERVSNFGAEQCYRLFLRLILQKLRMLQLKHCSSLINGEATSKYILTQLTSELYKHDIIEELTPEDVAFLLNYLPHKQSFLLLDKFYTQITEVEDVGKVLQWMSDSVLLEKKNFVILSLVLILQKISSKLNNLNKRNGASGIPFNALALNFVDEDYKINGIEYVKLVDHINELLNGGTDFPLDNNIKLTHMKIFLDIIKCLPLVHMPPEVSSLALSGLTFLAIVFSRIEELLKPLLLLIYNLALKISRSSTFSCFNVGLFIRWLLYTDSKCDTIQQVKQNLVKSLLKTGTCKENGLNELEELVNFMQKKKLKEDPKSLVNQILLYEDLGKTWIKTRKRNAENEEISRFRKILSKRIRKELERQNKMETPTADCEVLVMAYSIELTRAIKLKNEENIVNLLKLNFDKFFDIAVTKVQSGSREESYVRFLTTLLIHMPHIKDHLNKSTLKTIWNALKWKTKVDWKLFYTLADDREFEFFLLDLLKIWRLFVTGKNHKLDLENYFDIWKEFYKVDKQTNKKLYEKHLKNLFIDFSASIAEMNNFTPEQTVQLYNFIRFCISTNNIVMTSSMLDSSIDILYNYDYKETLSNKDFQNIFESCIDATSWSLTTRYVRTKDKIHNIFQLFVKLLDALGKRSSAKLDITEEDLLLLSSCAHNMEKWTSKMTKFSKDFSRMAVYFIAALVSSFVKINIYPAVKDPLVNCIHNFLSISDSHNISHLVRVFNPGSQQVFSNIYETYKKYYRYTGKI